MSKAVPISGSTRLVAIFGWPLTYTLSPAMQNRALAKAGIDALYAALPAPAPAGLRRLALGLMQSPHFIGANFTNPYKREALRLGLPSATAKAVGAANTLYRVQGHWRVDNTDAPGFIAAMAQAKVSLRGRAAWILGAGGAARALAYALGRAGVSRVNICARRRAQALACARLAGRKGRATGLDLRALQTQSQALVINTLPGAALGRSLGSRLPQQTGSVAVDISYVPLQTPFLVQAKARGWRTVSGVGMLEAQGRLAFERWFGKRAVSRAASVFKVPR